MHNQIQNARNIRFVSTFLLITKLQTAPCMSFHTFSNKFELSMNNSSHTDVICPAASVKHISPSHQQSTFIPSSINTGIIQEKARGGWRLSLLQI